MTSQKASTLYLKEAYSVMMIPIFIRVSSPNPAFLEAMRNTKYSEAYARQILEEYSTKRSQLLLSLKIFGVIAAVTGIAIFAGQGRIPNEPAPWIALALGFLVGSFGGLYSLVKFSQCIMFVKAVYKGYPHLEMEQ